MTVYAYAHSPLGDLLLVGDGAGLAGLYFQEHRRGPDVADGWQRDDDAFPAVRAQLDAYFAGRLQHFDVDLAPAGTAFQQQVWRALRTIRFGTTSTYGQLARLLDRDSAARAVGAAVARNPISIIVPCHRVVGSTGTLTGFAGGVQRKELLLALERDAVTRLQGVGTASP